MKPSPSAKPSTQPELAKFGVRAAKCKRIECLHCQSQWSVKPGRAGQLPADFWKCPKGCNAMLPKPGVRQQDKIEIEVYLAEAQHRLSQSSLKDLRDLKRARRKCDKLVELYQAMRSDNPPSLATVLRVCGFRNLSAARRRRVLKPKPKLIRPHEHQE